MNIRFPVFFTAAGAVILAGCARPEAPAAAVVRPTLVRAVPVVSSTAAVPIRAPGVLARKAEAELSFKLGGVVETVRVRAGDSVAAGQELARLRLDEADAQVVQAESLLEKARRDLGRVERLADERVATLENVQDARTAATLAAAQAKVAQFNRRHAVITAPSAGRILRRLAEPTEWVAPGRSIVVFASDAEGWLVRAGLAERDVARVEVGDRAEIMLDPADGATLAGRVVQVAQAADPATRTSVVEILLDSPPPRARSGSVVATTVHPRAVAARPVVPASALVEGEGRSASLFLVDAAAGIARRVKVEVEAIEGPNAFLRTPLAANQPVVSAGAEYLRDGAAIELKP